MKNTYAYFKAKKKIEARLGFNIHLLIYLAVNAILMTINIINSKDYLWFIWPLIGWGIAIYWHAMRVFILNEESEIRESMIRKEMEKKLSKEE